MGKKKEPFWNNRVVRQIANGEVFFGIHEVFYDKDGKPDMCTAEPVSPFGETVSELNLVLSRMKTCIAKPVLDMAYFDKLAKEKAEKEKERVEEIGGFCDTCGSVLDIVRPGKYQCPECV